MSTTILIVRPDKFMIVKKQPGGALMVQKNGSRFTLRVGMAHKIHVAKVKSM